MYQAHFGLKKSLFGNGIAQDAAVFLGAKQQLVVANSKIALTTFDSAVLFTGPAGVGKTTLAAVALRETSTRLALGWLNGSPSNASELLELLLVEFGFNVTRTGRGERLQMWRQFLNETIATDSRVFVIAERAEDLSPELLRGLESLTMADPSGCRGANLVLLGQADLVEHLKAPGLDTLRQRIRLRQRLEPLTLTELREYLTHQVSHAGGALDQIFAPDAIATLQRLSGGLPRMVNNLCETALTLAATRREPRLTAELLIKIAVGMFGIDEPAPPHEERSTSPTPTPAAPIVVPAPTAAIPSPSSAPVHSEVPPAAPILVAPAAPPPQPAVAQQPQTEVAQLPPPAAAKQPAPAAAQQPAPAVAQQPAPVVAQQPLPAVAQQPLPAVGQQTRPASAQTAQPIVARHPQPAAAASPPPAAVAKPSPGPATPLPLPELPRRAPAPAVVKPEALMEYDGGETDIAQELLTDEKYGHTADVPMADFPVLTDAVEAPAAPLARAPAAAAVAATARTTRPEPAAAQTARSPAPAVGAKPAAPTSSAAPIARSTAAPSAAAAAPKPAVAQVVPKPATVQPPKAAEDDDELRQTQTMRALATAKSIDDISNSMAETLFGEADLDMLSAALGAAGWNDSATATGEAAPAASTEASATTKVEADPFDLFDLGPDAPLELIDDSSGPRPAPTRKIANDR